MVVIDQYSTSHDDVPYLVTCFVNAETGVRLEHNAALVVTNLRIDKVSELHIKVMCKP